MDLRLAFCLILPFVAIAFVIFGTALLTGWHDLPLEIWRDCVKGLKGIKLWMQHMIRQLLLRLLVIKL